MPRGSEFRHSFTSPVVNLICGSIMTGFHGFQYGRMECIDKSAGIGRGGGLILLRPLHPEMANWDVVGGFLLGLPGAAETGFPAAPGSRVFSCDGVHVGLQWTGFLWPLSALVRWHS